MLPNDTMLACKYLPTFLITKESCLPNRDTLGMFMVTEKEASKGLIRKRTAHGMKPLRPAAG